jgi:hypothetical protein
MSLTRTLRGLPPAIGVGLTAGVVGTAAMTASSTIEMRLRRRQPSETPARAAAKVLGVQPADPRGERRFATMVHWAYGTSWGAARGVLGALKLRGVPATAAFFATVWGTELVVLPLLDVGVPPVWRWGAAEVAIDALHHVVYATATSAAYELLDEC